MSNQIKNNQPLRGSDGPVNAPITGIEGLVINNTLGGKVALDVRTVAILENIMETQELIPAIAETQSVGAIGTAIYRIQPLTPFYKWDGLTIPKFTAQSDYIKIDIDQNLAAEYKLPLVDLKRIENNEILAGKIEAGLGISCAKNLDAYGLQYLKLWAEADAANRVIYVNDTTTGDADVDKKNAYSSYQAIMFAKADFRKYIDQYTFGFEKMENLRLLIDPKFSVKLQMGVSLNQFGDKSLESFTTGKLPVGYLAGGVPVIESAFLDHKHAKWTASMPTFFGTDEFDFTDVLGILIYNEAFAQPRNIIQVGTWLDNDSRDPVAFMKAQFGMGILRPGFIKLIKRQAAPKTK